jgi:hypothetical protein
MWHLSHDPVSACKWAGILVESKLTAYSFGWWLVCSERKVLLAGCWWLVCSERKVLLAGC